MILQNVVEEFHDGRMGTAKDMQLRRQKEKGPPLNQRNEDHSMLDAATCLTLRKHGRQLPRVVPVAVSGILGTIADLNPPRVPGSHRGEDGFRALRHRQETARFEFGQRGAKVRLSSLIPVTLKEFHD